MVLSHEPGSLMTIIDSALGMGRHRHEHVSGQIVQPTFRRAASKRVRCSP